MPSGLGRGGWKPDTQAATVHAKHEAPSMPNIQSDAHLSPQSLDVFRCLVDIRQCHAKVTKALTNVIAVNTVVVRQFNCNTAQHSMSLPAAAANTALEDTQMRCSCVCRAFVPQAVTTTLAASGQPPFNHGPALSRISQVGRPRSIVLEGQPLPQVLTLPHEPLAPL